MSTAGKAIVVTSTQEMDEVMDDSEPVEATPSVPDEDMIHDGTESSQGGGGGGEGAASESSAGASYTADSDADVDGGDAEMAEEARADEDDSASDTSSEDDRDNAELAAIMLEIKDLENAVPLLRDSYHLIDRLGEGTFSSVYKAIDVHHTLYDNARWAPPSPPDSLSSGRLKGLDEPIVTTEAPSPPLSARSSPVVDPFLATSGETPRNGFAQQLQRQAIAAGKVTPSLQSRPSRKGPVYVALKRIYVTSSPQRILNELDLLADLRDARHVAYLIEAIRHEDQVIAVMPYQRHQDFRAYFRTASLSLIRSYLRCLFSALADAHSKSIIHRDVKPANFLFDVKSRTGYLCDFGLAERLDPGSWHGRCLHSLPHPKKGDVHGKLLEAPVSTFAQLQQQWGDWKKEHLVDLKSKTFSDEARRARPWAPGSEQETAYLVAEGREHARWKEEWQRAPTGGSLGGGMGRTSANERVGVKKDDQRPSVRANRAGTRGFRAPEVLLKCPDQTVALDVWSVGMILLCFLTRRFPFFNSNDDTEALLELAALLGRKRLEAAAVLHNRTVVTNIPHSTTPTFNNLHEAVRTLNPSLYAEQRPGPGRTSKSAIFDCHRRGVLIGEHDRLDPFEEEWYNGSELWECVQLTRAALQTDCTKRITAAKALKHPFLAPRWDAVG